MIWNSPVEDRGGVKDIFYRGIEVWNSMTCLGDGKEVHLGFPGGTNGKEPACQCRRVRGLGSTPGSGRFPGGGHGNPLQYSCLENPREQRSLMGYNPWGHRVRHDWSDWACMQCKVHRVKHRRLLKAAWRLTLKSLELHAKKSRLYSVWGGQPPKDFSNTNRCIYHESKPVKEGHKGGMTTKIGRNLNDGKVQKWREYSLWRRKWPTVDNTAERYQHELRDNQWILKFGGYYWLYWGQFQWYVGARKQATVSWWLNGVWESESKYTHLFEKFGEEIKIWKDIHKWVIYLCVSIEEEDSGMFKI